MAAAGGGSRGWAAAGAGAAPAGLALCRRKGEQAGFSGQCVGLTAAAAALAGAVRLRPCAESAAARAAADADWFRGFCPPLLSGMPGRLPRFFRMKRI